MYVSRYETVKVEAYGNWCQCNWKRDLLLSVGGFACLIKSVEIEVIVKGCKLSGCECGVKV